MKESQKVEMGFTESIFSNPKEKYTQKSFEFHTLIKHIFLILRKQFNDMTRFYRYFSFLFFLWCSPFFISQTLINGKITDEETGEDLIGASVKIVNSKYGTVSDFNGEFKLQTNIKPPFEIEVSYIGYSAKNLTISIKNLLKFPFKV